MKKSIYILLFLLPLGLVAQQESYYSLYKFHMNIINPAYAGAEAGNMFAFTSRRQWSALEDAPKTFAFSYSSARKNKVGLGVSIVSDKVFIEQQTFAYIDFSYRLEMGSETQLFLGLKGGGNFYSADPSSLTSYFEGVDNAKVNLSSFNPNIGAGAYLQGSAFWASFSIPRLFNVERNDDLAVTAKDRVHSYLAGGASFAVSNFMLKPSLMMRKVKGLPLTSELTAMIGWQNRIDIGVSFRSNSSMALMAFINVGMFDIGYAYETPSDQQLSGMSLKTHELVFRIRLEGKQDTKEGPVSPEEN